MMSRSDDSQMKTLIKESAFQFLRRVVSTASAVASWRPLRNVRSPLRKVWELPISL